MWNLKSFQLSILEARILQGHGSALRKRDFGMAPSTPHCFLSGYPISNGEAPNATAHRPLRIKYGLAPVGAHRLERKSQNSPRIGGSWLGHRCRLADRFL